MAFVEERLNSEISRGASFTLRDSVRVVETTSGREQRRALHSAPRRVYNIAFGLRPKGEIDEIRDFAIRVGGQRDGFRMKDWSDFEFEDEAMIPLNATGSDPSATATRWQLVKRYGTSIVRKIRKPVDGTLTFEFSQNPRPATQVDFTTGIVELVGGAGQFLSRPPTASGEFDVPVRFADSEIDTIIGYIANAQIPDIQLIELFGRDAQ